MSTINKDGLKQWHKAWGVNTDKCTEALKQFRQASIAVDEDLKLLGIDLRNRRRPWVVQMLRKAFAKE